MDSPSKHKPELNAKSKDVNNIEEFTNTMSRIHDAGQRLDVLLAYSEAISSSKKVFRSKTKICSKVCSTTSLTKTGCGKDYFNQNEVLRLELPAPMPPYKSTVSRSTSYKNENYNDAKLPTDSKNTIKPTISRENTYLIQRDILQPSEVKENKVHNTIYAEKTTYCRPAVNINDKDMKQNAKLQNLVKRLAAVRDKEKQIEAWNNYINELKNKHKFYLSESNKTPKLLKATENITFKGQIDPFNRKYISNRPNVTNDNRGDSNAERIEVNTTFGRPYNYASNSFCLPISSQARLVQADRERHKNKRYYNISCHPSWNSRGSYICTDYERRKIKKERRNKYRCRLCEKKIGCSEWVQTDLSSHRRVNRVSNTDFAPVLQPPCSCPTSHVTCPYEKIKREDEMREEERIRQEKFRQELIKQQAKNNDNPCCSLASIENKIDRLIFSVNTFIKEIKSKNWGEKPNRVCASTCIYKNKASKSVNINNTDIVCAVAQGDPGSKSIFLGSPSKRQNTIEEVMYEEMDKTDKLENDIEVLLKSKENPSSVQITFDIPTKKHSSKLIESVCKASEQIIEMGMVDNSRHITMAVNTDPLGLLALFRVSAETVKQILSYMPHLDYSACLARLQSGCSPTTDVGLCGYMCNICGFAFNRPSQLSDHIQRRHSKGKPRDCCVCRHVIDDKVHRSGLFACNHCGQMFTRAYCRELHEQSCTSRVSSSDTRASLMLLT